MRGASIIFVTSLAIMTGTEDIKAKNQPNIAQFNEHQRKFSDVITMVTRKPHPNKPGPIINSVVYASENTSQEFSSTSKHPTLNGGNTETTNTNTTLDLLQDDTSNYSGQDDISETSEKSSVSLISSDKDYTTEQKNESGVSGTTDQKKLSGKQYTTNQKKVSDVRYTTEQNNESYIRYTSEQKNGSDLRYTTNQKNESDIRYTSDDKNVIDENITFDENFGMAIKNSSTNTSEELKTVTQLTDLNTSTSGNVQIDGAVTNTSDHISTSPFTAGTTKATSEHGNVLRTLWKWLVGGGSLLMILGCLGPMIFQSLSKCKNKTRQV